MVSHIYREGNALADGLANLGVEADFINYSTSLPQSLTPVFLRDVRLLPSFRAL